MWEVTPCERPCSSGSCQPLRAGESATSLELPGFASHPGARIGSKDTPGLLRDAQLQSHRSGKRREGAMQRVGLAREPNSSNINKKICWVFFHSQH